MELRRRFNEDERAYDAYRPGYPEALFQDAAAYAGLGPESRLLEIGIGTGQATEPFLRLGCEITAVELGDRLSAFVSEKFADFPRFSVICGDFLEVPLEARSFDLVYSATAFHWLPPEAAYPKIRQILRPGGAVALFWNHPFLNREDDPTNVACQRVYEKFSPAADKPQEFSQKDCRKRLDELERFGFQEIVSRLYHRTRTLSSREYIGLMNTYSDHRAREPEIKAAFEREMREAIDQAGGSVHIYDTIDLYLARAPE